MELSIANKELVFQIEEKEKRASELSIANKELEAFKYISSHDLQEPLRKIKIFFLLLAKNEGQNLSIKGKDYLERMLNAAIRMQTLIEDLLSYSRLNITEPKFENTNLATLTVEVIKEFAEIIEEKKSHPSN